MQLYAPCHERAWNASQEELQKIRQLLGESWINNNKIFLDGGIHRLFYE